MSDVMLMSHEYTENLKDNFGLSIKLHKLQAMERKLFIGNLSET